VNPSKAKGTAAETAVKTRMRRWFPSAERRALAGAYDLGDITGIGGVCIEIKAHKRYNIGAWLLELAVEKANAKADVGVLVVKPVGVGDTRVGEWWAIMRLDDWCEMALDAGYPKRTP